MGGVLFDYPWPEDSQIVQQLVEHTRSCGPRAVTDYYDALRVQNFVILAGPAQVDKAGLAQALAEQVVGSNSLRNCRFQAHPWWATETGSMAFLADAHARFNELKLSGLLEMATSGESMGLPVFVVVERMSPAEVIEYFEDLPRGLLWQADGTIMHADLPKNLYLTGTWDIEDGEALAFDPEVFRNAAVIRLSKGVDSNGNQRYLPLEAESDWRTL